MVKVVLLNYAYESDLATGDALLARYPTLAGVASNLRAAGVDATIVQRFGRDGTLRRDGIECELVRDGGDPKWPVRRPMWRLHRRVAARRPALVHVNGTIFPLQVRLLRAMLPRPAAIVVQHHGERPMRGWRARAQAWGFRAADAFLFTAREQASEWREAHVVGRDAAIFDVMEVSTSFEPEPRDAARARMGVDGRPLFLWIGNLDRNKDPLTVLAGFDRLLAEHPEARLVMAFRRADLLPDVRAAIGGSTSLSRAVTLAGAVEHADVRWLHSAADCFVLGSHHEGSSYSLVEALACGVVPIVTDIPSFRVMTDGGRIGGLWRPGDPGAFARCAAHVLAGSMAEQSAAARAWFDAELTFTAIGRRTAAIYEAVVARRVGGATA